VSVPLGNVLTANVLGRTATSEMPVTLEMPATTVASALRPMLTPRSVVAFLTTDLTAAQTAVPTTTQAPSLALPDSWAARTMPDGTNGLG